MRLTRILAKECRLLGQFKKIESSRLTTDCQSIGELLEVVKPSIGDYKLSATGPNCK